MLGDFFRALGQMTDSRFVGVVGWAVLVTIALLAAVTALFLGAINWFVPDSFVLPWVGEVGGIDLALSWAFVLGMLVLSVFLMVPVASACTGMFLESVVDAVEDRHYQALPPITPLPLWDVIIDSLNFAGVVIAVNLVALIGYIFAGPFAPLLFWAVNGYLLGREYFTLVAQRRLGRDRAKALRRRHSGTVWAAGVLMAVPLSLPLVNLLIPVLGVATFTHLAHRLMARED
ncbi:MAG: EI24 domain-containing protein [Paracoccaceae bacterium]